MPKNSAVWGLHPPIAALRDCSEANIARDRNLGQGVPFLKIGNRVLYRKAAYLAWEEQHKPVSSTAEARTQARRLREVPNAVAMSREG
jgi:hypothetical protein